jgi:hypothetical protein
MKVLPLAISSCVNAPGKSCLFASISNDAPASFYITISYRYMANQPLAIMGEQLYV